MRVRRAVAAGLGLWTLTGIVLFSYMERLHPRYVEGFTPAVAAMLGIGAAWAAWPRGRLRAGLLAGTLLIVVYYAERLMYGTTATWWYTLVAALGALGCAALARVQRLPAAMRKIAAPAGVLALTLTAVLAVGLGADIEAIDAGVTDAGYVGALPSEQQRLLSSYLRSHQNGAKYEVAAQSATQIGSLIVQDARPILVLTTYGSRVFTTVPELQRAIARGEVRYAFLNSSCSRRAGSTNPACSAPARWIRENGTDVSREAGLRGKVLWRLPGVAA